MYEMFLSSKATWRGWRNEAFICERNTRSDIPELNVSRSSPEEGKEEKGKCHKIGGCRLTIFPSVV